MRHQTSLRRAAFATLLAVVAVVACGGVLRLFWYAGRRSVEAVADSGPDSPSDLILVGVCVLGAALTAWLGLGVALSALATLPGALGRSARQAAERLAPVVVRRGVALLLGSALVAAAAPAAAHADPSEPSPTFTTSASPTAPPAPDPAFAPTGRAPAVDAHAPGRAGSVAAATVGPAVGPSTGPAVGATSGTVPDPAFSPAPTTAPTTASTTIAPAPVTAPTRAPATPPGLGPLGQAPRPSAREGEITVVRGDTLWRIAARHLGSGATAAQIAREWPRWYALNRAVIGADPAVIHPGQVLTVPAPEGTSS